MTYYVSATYYVYATPILCDNNPLIIMELDPDSGDHDLYIRLKPRIVFSPSQIKTTLQPNAYTAQDAVIYLNAEIDQFWD